MNIKVVHITENKLFRNFDSFDIAILVIKKMNSPQNFNIYVDDKFLNCKVFLSRMMEGRDLI